MSRACEAPTSTSRLRRASAAAVTAAALLGGVVACAPGSGNGQNGTGTTTAAPPATTEPQPTAGQAGPGGVTQEQAADLCSRMEDQLQSWRTYTPTVGKGGLNLLVGEWAAANGIDVVALAGDRGRIDTITSEQCPDVRDGALSALDIPDLASALVGY